MTPPVAQPVPPPSCTCSVSAQYNANASITLDFDLCGAQPARWDWIGIYKCDAATVTATEDWWTNRILPNPGYIGMQGVPLEYYGYVEDQVYVLDQQLWWSYTCGSPSTLCGKSNSTAWPSMGTVLIDPATSPDFAFWGNGEGSFDRVLDPGCYKVLLNRELKDAISPPPLPTICPGQPWLDAFTFNIP